MKEIEKTALLAAEKQCTDMNEYCINFRCMLEGIPNIGTISEDESKWRKFVKLYNAFEEIEFSIFEIHRIIQEELNLSEVQED